MFFNHPIKLLGRSTLTLSLMIALCLGFSYESLAQYQPFGSHPYSQETSTSVSSALITPAASTSFAPQVIHWASHGLAIPYRWSGTAGNQNAKQVVLYASRDRGNNWQQVSTAAPQVHSFQYQAPADGEYWFAIRTYDLQGNYEPAGPLKPEMRVVVDTQRPNSPRVESNIVGGILTARVEAGDLNGIDLTQLQIYAQFPGQPSWTPLTIQPMGSTNPNSTQIQGTLRLPTGVTQVSLHVSVADKAGNRSVATSTVSAQTGYYQASNGPQLNGPQTQPQSVTPSQAPRDPFFLADQQYQGRSPAFTTAPASPSQPFANLPSQPVERSNTAALRQQAQPVAAQPWPVDSHRTERITAPPQTANRVDPFRSNSPFQSASFDPSARRSNPGAAPTVETKNDPWGAPVTGIAGIRSTQRSVNSLSFEFDYELERTGQWGIANVELWGTRDGGNSWRRYAIDSDRQSPIHVTVPEEGVYGFKILIESVGGFEPEKPRPGDQPEVMVRVDVTKPQLTLTRAEQGQGYLADRMEIAWSVGEEDLADRPIDLFYSNRREGPWIPIANGLDNTGQYAWRLQRHLPDFMYIRIQARDRAGNISSAVSPQPVGINLPQSTGTLRGIRSAPQVNSSFGY